MNPAGFRRRYVAWTLDAAIVLLILLPLAAVFHGDGVAAIGRAVLAAQETMAAALVEAMENSLSAIDFLWQAANDRRLAQAVSTLLVELFLALLPIFAAYIVSVLVYHVGFESSPLQATPGKRALGLRVADAAGRRLPARRVLLRHLAGALSWLSLHLGHTMAAVAPRHRSLHDRIAGAQVLAEGDTGAALPGWARAWVLLQVALAFAATCWLLATWQAGLAAAVDRALMLL